MKRRWIKVLFTWILVHFSCFEFHPGNTFADTISWNDNRFHWYAKMSEIMESFLAVAYDHFIQSFIQWSTTSTDMFFSAVNRYIQNLTSKSNSMLGAFSDNCPWPYEQARWLLTCRTSSPGPRFESVCESTMSRLESSSVHSSRSGFGTPVAEQANVFSVFTVTWG